MSYLIRDLKELFKGHEDHERVSIFNSLTEQYINYPRISFEKPRRTDFTCSECKNRREIMFMDTEEKVMICGADYEFSPVSLNNTSCHNFEHKDKEIEYDGD